MAGSTLSPVVLVQRTRHGLVAARVQPPTLGTGGQRVVLKVWDAKLSWPNCAGAVG